MNRKKYNVFISYRRQHSSELAQLVQKALTERGFQVFLDVRELGAGHFDEALLKRIEESRDFVLILTLNSLDRCTNENDWFATEIAQAIKTKRNIIPLVSQGFKFPSADKLPEPLRTIPRHQCVVYNHLYSDESIARLLGMLKSRKRISLMVIKSIFLGLLVVLLLLAGFYFYQYRPDKGPASKLKESLPQTKQVLPPLALYWHGFGQRRQNGRWSEFIVYDGTTMYSGDQFRLVFSPNEDCYAYIISIGSDDTTSVLFPHEAINMDNRVRGGEKYQIPDGINWFTLDESVGKETLYLLASYNPLDNLDSLIKKPSERVESTRMKEQVETEITTLSQSLETKSEEKLRTRDGKIVLRGVNIQSDQRIASVALSSGQQVKHVMQFEPGSLNVVKRIQIRHKPRP